MSVFLIKQEDLTPVADEIRIMIDDGTALSLEDMRNFLNEVNTSIVTQDDIIVEIEEAIDNIDSNEGSNNGTYWIRKYVSSDLWTLTIDRVYYAQNMWIGTNDSDMGICFSYDGKSWEPSNLISGNWEVVYKNGIWVANSLNGNGLNYSINGELWYSSNLSSGTWRTPYFSDGIWITSGGLEQGLGVYYSIDGKNWVQTNLTEGRFGEPYYNKGLWLISGDITVDNGYGARMGLWGSTDGKEWELYGFEENNLHNIIYANGTWVGIEWDTQRLYYSKNGKDWERVTTVPDDEVTELLWADGRWFMAHNHGSSAYSSLDGITWEESKYLGGYHLGGLLLHYANGWFLGGPDLRYYSKNGIEWEELSEKVAPVYNNGIWLTKTAYSTDAINWTPFNVTLKNLPVYGGGIWVSANGSYIYHSRGWTPQGQAPTHSGGADN